MSQMARLLVWLVWLGLASGAAVSPAGAVDEPPLVSAWAADHASRARLLGGHLARTEPTLALLAGLEITLDDGWKTYWRHPGASGVPPRFDWSKSDNLAGALVLYPAPQRYSEADGETIGYKKRVVFPIELTPKDPTRPITLRLELEYGACREVCIPVQAELLLKIPIEASPKVGDDALTRALEKVPRPDATERDPKLDRVRVELASPKPQIVIDVSVPGGAKSADAFLEAPGGAWIPMTQRVPDRPAGKARFIVDLADGADLGDLKGKTIRLTLVSDSGQSESTFVFE